MKKSTYVSFFFFVVAILFEFLSRRQAVQDLRLFVGVFIVLGLAFMIYSIQETVTLTSTVLFNQNIISKEAFVSPHANEYRLEAGHPYLWIKNSIYLNWENDSKIRRFKNGIFAALGGQRLGTQSDIYILFMLDQEVYVKTKKIGKFLESDNVNVLEKGPAYRYYSKLTVYSMIFTVVLLVLSVLSLLGYILIQLF